MLPSVAELGVEQLGEGLTMCVATSQDDVERVAAFNGTVHNPGVAEMTRRLFTHHPNTRRSHLIYVEERGHGEVVSSLCLIPWTWRFEDVEIRVGEMGIVGTREDYRNRGLIRAQVNLFKRCLNDAGCLLSKIQGIPYFYRQFGYEYALPLEGGLRLEYRDVPDQPVVEGYSVRLATVEDAAALKQLYDEAAKGLDLTVARGVDIWHYLLTQTSGTDTAAEFWVVLGPSGRIEGYVKVPKHHFHDELFVNEASRLSFNAALAVFRHVAQLGQERGTPGIRLSLPEQSVLMRIARGLGCQDLGAYAWQIHIPSLSGLLRALGPILERRVSDSPFAGLSRDVTFSTYRETVLMHWVDGRLAGVHSTSGCDGDVCLRVPPLQAVVVLLGHRTVGELKDVYPDVGVSSTWRVLVDTLFPRVNAFVSYSIY
ncbi:MAG: GNAT family N-acetyltransferase [Chloroflexi bacterium]|nr:GNAT family N-acetyltransferase [Chloroflexota bacterium]